MHNSRRVRRTRTRPAGAPVCALRVCHHDHRIRHCGLVVTVGTLTAKCGHIVKKVWTAHTLSAENQPLCAALARQLEVLRKSVQGMRRAPPVELDAMGPVLDGALGQLATDMAVVEKKLQDLASPKSSSHAEKARDAPSRKSRARAPIEKVLELKNAGEVNAALLMLLTRGRSPRQKTRDADSVRKLRRLVTNI